MSHNYANGAKAERLAMSDLRRAGWECVRSAGSHGAVDVVAWNDTAARLIQVKKDAYISRDEREALQALIAPANATVEIWRRAGAGRTRRWIVETWTGQAWKEIE